MTVTVERAALAGLWSVAGIGEVRIAKLREQLDLVQIATLDPREWLGRSGLEPDHCEALDGMSLVERGHELLRKARVCSMKVAFFGEKAYPKLITEAERPPPMLFYRGRGEVPNKRRVALVGTRLPENDILGFARELAADVARQGMGVVSGCANGIDQVCQSGSVGEGGETWAVLACGLDQIDLSQRGPCDQILEAGGTVWTEFPPGVRGNPKRFPRRNRLIAWSSDVTVVIRGDPGSGAWYTADYAKEVHRPVLAVPASPQVEQGTGTNARLRAGKALWCLGVADVLDAMGLDSQALIQAPIAYSDVPVSARAQLALDALKKETIDFDEWLYRMKGALTSSALRAVVMELELAGKVVEGLGKRFLAR